MRVIHRFRHVAVAGAALDLVFLFLPLVTARFGRLSSFVHCKMQGVVPEDVYLYLLRYPGLKVFHFGPFHSSESILGEGEKIHHTGATTL